MLRDSLAGVSFGALRLVFIVVTALLLAWSTRMPPAQWLEQLEAQRAGQMTLLLARAASLAMLLVIAPALPKRERRAWVLAALALCVASLAFNVATMAFALVVVVASFRVRSTAPSHAYTAIACVVGVAAGLALAQREATHAAMPTDARGAALYWERRDNPFRALSAARAWSASEARPGEALLCTARIAERLGDIDDARAMRETVATNGADDAIRAQARALLIGGAP